MEIGENIRKLRESKNLSQQYVADYVGVERKTYLNWEAGETSVKSVFIPKLAELFNVEIGDLYQGKSSDIIITQNNSDNKDNSANGIIIILNDKKAVNELVNLIKKKYSETS